MFKTRCGRPINSDHLAREFKRLLREAGLPPMRLYDLRHTAATLALTAGVSAKVVSEQLGHASSAFTLDVYAHVLPHMQSEAAVRVAALLGMGGCEQQGIRAGTKETTSICPSRATVLGRPTNAHAGSWLMRHNLTRQPHTQNLTLNRFLKRRNHDRTRH